MKNNWKEKLKQCNENLSNNDIEIKVYGDNNSGFELVICTTFCAVHHSECGEESDLEDLIDNTYEWVKKNIFVG